MLLAQQDGVAARRQLVTAGLADHDIARLVRRRDLTRVHPGVFVDHTGLPTWRQRAWAGVLSAWPAALGAESVLPGPPALPLHIAVAAERRPRPLPGVRWHRTVDFEERVAWVRSPPRIRVEHAVLDVAVGRRADEQFRLLADVLQSRQTTVPAIRAALADRTRVRGRGDLLAALDDLESGASSVLERAYLRLERDHGLPTAERQRAVVLGATRRYSDAVYRAYGLVVELDGRAFHDDARSRDADAERDLDLRVLRDELTVRLTWGQVLGRGCATIAKVAALLESRGWAGGLVRCAACAGPVGR